MLCFTGFCGVSGTNKKITYSAEEWRTEGVAHRGVGGGTSDAVLYRMLWRIGYKEKNTQQLGGWRTEGVAHRGGVGVGTLVAR